MLNGLSWDKIDLLFLNVFHHAVNSFLRGDVCPVDQGVGRRVKVLAAVEHEQMELEIHNCR